MLPPSRVWGAWPGSSLAPTCDHAYEIVGPVGPSLNSFLQSNSSNAIRSLSLHLSSSPIPLSYCRHPSDPAPILMIKVRPYRVHCPPPTGSGTCIIIRYR